MDAFRSTASFLKDFSADESQMSQFILGTIARLDQPLSASQQGSRAYYNYFTRVNAQDVKRERDEVLNTTPADIIRYAEMIDKVIGQGVHCTYGNAETLQTHQAFFKHQVRL